MKIKQLLHTGVTTIALALGVLVAVPAPVSAINVFSNCGSSGGNSSVCGASTTDSVPSLLKTVINILLYLIGIIAVIMIIIGGIRYTISNGDSGSMKSAKDTILYAVIGLVVAILAYAIVNFVVKSFGS